MNIQDPTTLAISILSLILCVLIALAIYQMVSPYKLRKEITEYESECADNYKDSRTFLGAQFQSTSRNLLDIQERVDKIEKHLYKPLYNVGEVVEWDEEFGTVGKGEIVSILERDPYQGINVQYNVEVLMHSHPTKVYKTINERDITAWH